MGLLRRSTISLNVMDELRALVSAMRGALLWHKETGDHALPVPPGFKAPTFNPPDRPFAHDAPTPPASRDRQPQGPAPTAVPVLVRSPADRQAALEALRAEVGDCQRCPLSNTRSHIVFGHGPVDARVLFVLDAPAIEDDATGKPYGGEAGALLEKMIGAMGLGRTSVYLGHVVMCHPGVAAVEPEADSIAACRRFLLAQIELVSPEVIVTCGALLTRILLGTASGVRGLLGKWHTVSNRPVLVGYSPAYLVKNPDEKRKAWEILKMVMTRLERAPRKP